MTNATVLKHVEDTVSTYSDEQQLDAAMREKIAKLLESPEKDSHKTAQQVVDTVDSLHSGLSSEHKGSLKHSVFTMLADASPSTPPAGKPSLSPPPPDTPCESSTAGSVTSDKPNDDDVTAASSHNGPHNHNGISHTISLKAPSAGSSLHANARAFVPNVNAPAFVPSSVHHIKVASCTADGHAENGYANGYANGDPTGFSPSALSGTSPHAAWDQAAVSEASGYQNGWYEGYGGYADPYAGYGYGAMTPDGLFVPQQADPSWGGMGPQQGPVGYQGRKRSNGTQQGSKQYAMEADAALAVLKEQFPLYNQDSLTDVLKVNGNDLVGALDMLAQLESEQTGQRKQFFQAPPSLDENNFPSLATSPGPSPRAAANGPASADGPTLEATAVAESDDTESPKAAEKPRAVQKVPSVWGSVEGSAHKATSPEKSSGAGWISKGDSMSSQQKAQAANSKLQPSAASFKSRNKSTSKVPWVETGAAVSGQYADAREEARDHARLRNMYFQQATQAYLAGNKALAKELGAKGRHHSDEMKAAHAAASESIFQQRNMRNASSAVSNKNGVILLDLHGLHVNESLKILGREIGQLQEGGQGKGRVPVRVHILVGTGHHTKGSRTPARLPVAVETFLQGEGLKYTKPDPGLLQLVI